MKRIKGVRKNTHKLIIKAVADYYFNGTNLKVSKYLEGEKIILTDEEKSDVWAIRVNLEDELYRSNLILQ